MNRRISMLAAAIVMATASTSLAQPKEPIPRFVIDARAASVGLPAAEGWTPAVPVGTEVPARTLGLDVGGHVYVARFGGVTLGLGGSYVFGRGKTSPQKVDAGTSPTPPPPVTEPDVTTRFSSLVPQVSLNFGHKLGWSYVSGGLGRARVESSATATALTVAPLPVDSEWVQTIHYGGGARWFVNERVGVGFDLRWHRLGGLDNGAPGQSLLTFGAGVSLR